MNENRLFVRSGHNHLLFSLLSLKKGRKQVQISLMDANVIQAAPECRDTGGLDCLYCGALGRNVYFPK
jgi:hypothetical protein